MRTTTKTRINHVHRVRVHVKKTWPVTMTTMTSKWNNKLRLSPVQHRCWTNVNDVEAIIPSKINNRKAVVINRVIVAQWRRTITKRIRWPINRSDNDPLLNVFNCVARRRTNNELYIECSMRNIRESLHREEAPRCFLLSDCGNEASLFLIYFVLSFFLLFPLRACVFVNEQSILLLLCTMFLFVIDLFYSYRFPLQLMHAD